MADVVQLKLRRPEIDSFNLDDIRIDISAGQAHDQVEAVTPKTKERPYLWEDLEDVYGGIRACSSPRALTRISHTGVGDEH